ncbi:hypothetical protein [Rhizobium ruizarguesonis]|uniref:hypothetical protein n=1 Tax=Rhizobium ruizarguesonis TaxID=2081791 RepID=UPI00371CA023
MPKPTTAVEGTFHLRKFLVKLFDRDLGNAADWPLLAETMLLEVFHALDQAPDDPRTIRLLRRAGAGMYDRLAGNWPSLAPGTQKPSADDFNPKASPPGPEGPPEPRSPSRL